MRIVEGLFGNDGTDRMTDAAILEGAKADDRRQAVIAAADEILSEKGLDGLTIRAVLERSGLARRAFYESFATKDDLILALFESAVKEAAEILGEGPAGEASPLDRLHAIVMAIVLARSGQGLDAMQRGDQRGAAYSREHLRLAEARPAELQKAIAPLIRLIQMQIARGVAEGKMTSDDPRMSAVLLYNLVSTTVHTELLRAPDGKVDAARRQKLAAQIWQFCRRALAA